MKYISILIFVLFTKITLAQEYSKESFFEIRVGYMPTLGKVNVQGENTPWINTLSSDADFNNKGDSFVSTNIGVTYGKYLSPQIRLGLGVDFDFYNNISEGHTSRTIPFFGDFKYTFNESKKGIFAYAQVGYSFITGMDWHSGFKSGFGIGFTTLGPTDKHGFNFSIGYNYQTLNKLSQQILGPPMNGEGYYGPTTVRYLSFVGYKNIAIQTLPLKIAYEF
jgi:hypothetical protein